MTDSSSSQGRQTNVTRSEALVAIEKVWPSTAAILRQHSLPRDYVASTPLTRSEVQHICRENKKTLGICIRCSKDAIPGRVQCKKHLEDQRQRSRDYWKRLSSDVAAKQTRG